MAVVYLGLGSNLGHREKNLSQCLRELEGLDCLRVIRKASIYEAEPVGFKNQGWFLNTVVKIETKIPPLSLFYLLKGIEKKIGRGKGKRWGPREIDLDMLLYDNMVMSVDKLILPHSELHKRKFVLVPMVELNSRLKHPVLNLTFKKLLKNIKERQEVRLVKREWKS